MRLYPVEIRYAGGNGSWVTESKSPLNMQLKREWKKQILTLFSSNNSHLIIFSIKLVAYGFYMGFRVFLLLYSHLDVAVVV